MHNERNFFLKSKLHQQYTEGENRTEYCLYSYELIIKYAIMNFFETTDNGCQTGHLSAVPFQLLLTLRALAIGNSV